MIHAPITDDELPGVEATFSFTPQGSNGLVLVGVRVSAMDGTPLSITTLPLSRWERRARGAAAKQLLATEQNPSGNAEEVAASLVAARYPELEDATHGNALRRRKGLLKLAKAAAEYAEATAAGAQNPAETLAERYDTSAATVRGWLHRARREGLAPASIHPNATVNKQGATS